jgi:hypothetical protein
MYLVSSVDLDSATHDMVAQVALLSKLQVGPHYDSAYEAVVCC